MYQNYSRALSGKPLSAEHCKKLSAAQKGKPLSSEAQLARVAKSRGRKLLMSIAERSASHKFGKIQGPPPQTTRAKIHCSLPGLSIRPHKPRPYALCHRAF